VVGDIVNGVDTSRVNGGWKYTDSQIPLTKLGEQQARDAGPLIAELRDAYPIASAHVSPVKRAQDTLRIATDGQPPPAKTVTDNGLAERGMGGYIGQDKLENRPGDTQDIKLGKGRQDGMIGPDKTPPSVPVQTSADGARPTPQRPIEDRTGYEDWGAFNGRIKSSFNQDILPDLINGGVLQVSHQYSIAAQLKRIDPRIDTAELGHGIPNGQPLVMIVRVQPQANGKEPKLTVVEAGYYKGNAAGSEPSPRPNP
jgi:bisphosphoglycerate-dependent phosphoglycerate mutase